MCVVCMSVWSVMYEWCVCQCGVSCVCGVYVSVECDV